uniref:protein ANKUB1-like n=1 Tax=Pristiophorus japonicus TaxID=55135 RepID=UPI00398F2F59
MRIFIAFETFCEPFDILQEQTVLSVKLMIKHHFCLSLLDDKQGRRYLELVYAGAVLEDNWVLADVGITSCSTLKCLLKEEDKPVLYVFNALTRQTVPIMEKPQFLTATVAELKSLVSLKSGLPVSTFRLSTRGGTELYNCNKMDDYQLVIGSILRLDIWDGWKEFMTGCLLGHKHIIQRYLSEEERVAKFQQRVALHMAAHFGHLDLAGWLLKRGVRGDQPVGVHPYREWCRQTDHPGVDHCPVHASAEAGQLLLLKVLVNHSVLCLECRNPQGHTPLGICAQRGHWGCISYLVAKARSVLSFPGLPLPVHVYLKIKRWLRQVRGRVWRGEAAAYTTRVGDTLVVDGFTEIQMRSRPKRRGAGKEGSGTQPTLPPLTWRVPIKRLKPVRLDSRWQSPDLPAPKLPAVEHKQRSQSKALVRKARDSPKQNLWKVKVPLPPICSDTNPRPHFVCSMPNATGLLTSSLQSFSEHNGRTARENAIYCLAWLHQLASSTLLPGVPLLEGYGEVELDVDSIPVEGELTSSDDVAKPQHVDQEEEKSKARYLGDSRGNSESAPGLIRPVVNPPQG